MKVSNYRGMLIHEIPRCGRTMGTSNDRHSIFDFYHANLCVFNANITKYTNMCIQSVEKEGYTTRREDI